MIHITKFNLNELSYEVLGACIEVHKRTGPGLLESIYHKCLIHELEYRGLNHKSELIIPFDYRDKTLDLQLRCDFFIDDILVLEIKSVKKFDPIFDAQLYTYMKLLKSPKGILVNFSVSNIFKDGQRTLVNEYFRDLPEI